MNKCFLFCLFTGLYFYGQSQIVDGNAYIKGQFLEIGINQCGGFGTTNIAPAGYHPRSAVYIINPPADDQKNLGFVADTGKDGWTTGTPNKYSGDYFMPGSPYIGWGIQFDQNTFRTDRKGTTNPVCASAGGFQPFGGSNISVSNSSGKMVAVWSGINSGLELQKTITVKDTTLYFVIEVKLTNTTGSSMNNIYYLDYVDPDNDWFYQDLGTFNYNTKNNIYYQNPADGKSLVESRGAIIQTYLGLGSKDCRSKVYRGLGGPNVPSGTPEDFYSGLANISLAGSDPDFTKDDFIGISFSLGTLAPGESTTFLYTYILNAADFNTALAETDPSFSVYGNTYPSNSTINICSNSLIPIKIIPGNDYTWSWSPAVTFNNTQGSNVNANVGSIPITYTASGTGPCSSKNVIINIVPVTHADPTVNISASPSGAVCDGTNISFTAAVNTPGPNLSYQWQINGNPVGINSPVFSSSTLANNNIVNCIVTVTDAACIPTPVAYSNSIQMNISTNFSPSVTIFGGSQTVCTGTPVSFTATPLNAGTNPSYQWKVNGINVGTNSSAFTLSSPSNNDIITCTLTSALTCIAGSNVVVSNSIQLSVSGPVTPSVTISISSGSQTVCTGTPVTFTAVPANGGPAPSYQWQVNGINAGTNNSVFTSSAFSDNDIVSIIMLSNAPCASPLTATGNSIQMHITPATVIPSVSIAITSGSQAICAGTLVSFAATAVNGGTSPVIQWKVNGINSGSPGSIFTFIPNNNDVITSVLTSNALCLAINNPVSNSIQLTVNPTVAPTIIISASSTVVCTGSQITFTSAITNGGSSPVYQWKINNFNTGTNSPVFSGSSFSNGDVVTCFVTGNAPCNIPAMAASNAVVLNINQPVTPSVSITSDVTTICTGGTVHFNAVAVNSGISPSYQWKVNNVNAGTNSPLFTIISLQNGDIINCSVTTDPLFTCTTSNTGMSNSIVINVSPVPAPIISISTSRTDICSGDQVSFTASVQNAGINPVYQWKINNLTVPANNPVYTSSLLQNGDMVSCTVTVNNTCSVLPTSSNIIPMTVYPQPQVTLSPANTIIPAGSKVTLNAAVTGNFVSYTWTPASLLENPLMLSPITKSLSSDQVFKFSVATTEGCSVTKSLSIKVYNEIHIPSAFTPDNNGVNDQFRLPPGTPVILDDLSVYDRWGNKVFSTVDIRQGWNGTYRGFRLPSGNYVYIITGNFRGQKLNLKGTVMLLR